MEQCLIWTADLTTEVRAREAGFLAAGGQTDGYVTAFFNGGSIRVLRCAKCGWSIAVHTSEAACPS